MASMPHANGAVAAGLAGCALIVVMITTQTSFAALFSSVCSSKPKELQLKSRIHP